MTWNTVATPMVAAETYLESWKTGWVKVYANPDTASGGRALVTLDERLEGQANYALYRYTGSTALNGNQRVTATIRTGFTAEECFALLARCSAGGAAYYATFVPFVNKISLYQLIINSGVVLQTVTAAFTASTEYTGCFMKVTGTNPCVVTVGTDTHGTVITYNDSSAGRMTSGYPGLSFNSANCMHGSAAPAWIKNVVMEDWTTGSAVEVLNEPFTMARWHAATAP